MGWWATGIDDCRHRALQGQFGAGRTGSSAHIEFAREVVRSFNYRYNTQVLIEPEMKVTEVPKVLALMGNRR